MEGNEGGNKNVMGIDDDFAIGDSEVVGSADTEEQGEPNFDNQDNGPICMPSSPIEPMPNITEDSFESSRPIVACSPF